MISIWTYLSEKNILWWRKSRVGVFFRLWSFDLHEKTENFSNWNKFWKNQNRQFSSYQLSQALFWKVFKHSFQIKYQNNNIKLILTIFDHLNFKKGHQIRLFCALFKMAIIFLQALLVAEFLICCRVCSGGSNEHINVKIGLDKKNRFFMKHPNRDSAKTKLTLWFLERIQV